MLQVGLENIALQRQVGKLAFADDCNETRGFQLLNMMGQGGRRHGLALAHIRAGNALVFRADLLQNLMAAWIGERLRDPAYLTLREQSVFGQCYSDSDLQPLFYRVFYRAARPAVAWLAPDLGMAAARSSIAPANNNVSKT